jgi:hypothetical protein
MRIGYHELKALPDQTPLWGFYSDSHCTNDILKVSISKHVVPYIKATSTKYNGYSVAYRLKKNGSPGKTEYHTGVHFLYLTKAEAELARLQKIEEFKDTLKERIAELSNFLNTF